MFSPKLAVTIYSFSSEQPQCRTGVDNCLPKNSQCERLIMQTAIPAPGTTSWCRRLLLATAALGLLLAFGFAQTASAQNVTTACTPTSLCLDNNYFVTGDYVVGGAVLNGAFVNGLQMGTIMIPDPAQPLPPKFTNVPAGADIVAAFLYWQTVESTNQGAITGQVGSFNNYPITGTVLGNPNAPTSWSSGGCSGNSSGSKTIRTYRADVRPILPLDANGNILTPNAVTPGVYNVGLVESGKTNGNGVPITLGASLVIIWRVLSPAMPLNSIIIYDGSAAPSNTASTITQPMVGFYQAAASPMAKITHIVGNGQTNKSEIVSFNDTTLPSLYTHPPLNPPFPGTYNGSWDNVTWTGDNSPINTLVHAGDFTETTKVTPTDTNGNCIDWGAIIFSTIVQDSDGDGLLDAWEDNQGYIDAKNGQWVALPGAYKYVKDIFAEVDYLSNLDGSAGTYLHSHLPQRAALDMVGAAFANAPVPAAAGCAPPHVCSGINVHFDLGPGIYQGQGDPYVIPYPNGAPLAGPPGVPTFPGDPDDVPEDDGGLEEPGDPDELLGCPGEP